MLTTVTVLTVFVALATLLPLWRNPHWSVRSFDFPRLQLSLLALLLIIAQLLLLDLTQPLSLVLVTVTVLALAAQLWWILPYTMIWPKEVKDARLSISPDQTLTILTSNVLTPNRNAAALIALVREYKPDILVTIHPQPKGFLQ